MLPRFQYSVVLAFILVLLYLLLLRKDSSLSYGQHVVDILKGGLGGTDTDFETGVAIEEPLWPIPEPESKHEFEDPAIVNPEQGVGEYDGWLPSSAGSAEVAVATEGVGEESHNDGGYYGGWPLSSTSSAEAASATSEALGEIVGVFNSTLQAQFKAEYNAFESNESTGFIYGNTLNHLVDIGAHEGFAAAALTPTDSLLPYTDQLPYLYNPYPDYNSKAWKAGHQGTYYACDGPQGPIQDLLVFSGHPKIFGEPLMGSYIPLDIDSNLCFERESRLGPYGFQKEGPLEDDMYYRIEDRNSGDFVDWGVLQDLCAKRNVGRFYQGQTAWHVGGSSVEEQGRAAQNLSASGNITLNSGKLKKPSTAPEYVAKRQYNTLDVGVGEMEESYPSVKTYGNPELSPITEVDATVEEKETPETHGKEVLEDDKLHGMPKVRIEPSPRTAVLIRSYTGQKYTENNKQNIRSLVSELCLRSGGEYQVFLLVQVKHDYIALGEDAYQQTLRDNIPQEFWNMTILWNDAQMRDLYPLVPEEINNVHQSQWLSVQKFSQDHPEFNYVWNWEFDSRYIGHHYSLLEKLARFAKAQPRRGLWERNERYYIPSFHGQYSKFRLDTERASGSETIWGAPHSSDMIRLGPTRPFVDPTKDNYAWGVGEEADYISLAPIFNPVNTTWPGRDDVWGYGGSSDTPRRASIGTQSRCSRNLLDTMHAENLKGNHVSSEMTPQTVSLLHGLKAVFAPIPIFFDRAWPGESLEKYFNPGPKGQSGSTRESPFSWGKEGRFNGSTWYFRATPPMRLYNNWLGWEDNGIGGPEWEKAHGRTCLPPVLLHPVKDVEKPPPGYSSKSDLPY